MVVEKVETLSSEDGDEERDGVKKTSVES